MIYMVLGNRYLTISRGRGLMMYYFARSKYI